MNLLALAFYLSILSYTLGNLIRALPVPFISVKRLGRNLVVDGIFSATLVFSYKLLLDLMNYIGGVLRADWSSYLTWLTDRTLYLATYISILKVLGVGFSKIGLGFIAQSLITPAMNLMTTSLVTVTIASIISVIIYSSAGELIALGIAFHAVPFRLTRSVGATIIAMTMVFSIGLPLMPAFTYLYLTVSSPILVGLGPYCTGEIRIADLSSNPLGNAVIEGYNRDGELLYRYIANRDGKVVVNRIMGYPCESHTMLIYIADQRYMINVPTLDNGKANLTVVIPNIFSLHTNRFLLVTSKVKILNWTRQNNSFLLEVNLEEKELVKVYAESMDAVQVLVNNEPRQPVEKSSIEIHGVNYTIYTFELPAGRLFVNVSISYISTTMLTTTEYYYTAWLYSKDPGGIDKLVTEGTYVFMELTVLPLVYLSMLVMISLSIARLIGGAYASFARHMVGL